MAMQITIRMLVCFSACLRNRLSMKLNSINYLIPFRNEFPLSETYLFRGESFSNNNFTGDCKWLSSRWISPTGLPSLWRRKFEQVRSSNCESCQQGGTSCSTLSTMIIVNWTWCSAPSKLNQADHSRWIVPGEFVPRDLPVVNSLL